MKCRGATIWFTGLSGAGKTTIAKEVEEKLRAAGHMVEVLDGDMVRQNLTKGLGFSKEDRDENIRRIGFVAHLLTRNGVFVVVAAISPYREIRDEVRGRIGDFIEVYVNAPLPVCEQRDVKGLYKKARSGEIKGFTGIDDPYEPPLHPDVECRTDVESVEESAAKVLRKLREKGFLRQQDAYDANMSHKFWTQRIGEHLEVGELLAQDGGLLDCVEEVAKKIVHSLKGGGRLLACGNGGSAADAQHIAAELVGRFFVDRRALDAEALSVNTSSLTCIGNDYRYEDIFARQVEAKGRQGDVLLAISTSGNSPNIIAALRAAKKLGMITVGLTGGNRESQIYKEADYCIGVPSRSTPRIQECHILIGHMVCEYIERAFVKAAETDSVLNG